MPNVKKVKTLAPLDGNKDGKIMYPYEKVQPDARRNMQPGFEYPFEQVTKAPEVTNPFDKIKELITATEEEKAIPAPGRGKVLPDHGFMIGPDNPDAIPRDPGFMVVPDEPSDPMLNPDSIKTLQPDFEPEPNTSLWITPEITEDITLEPTMEPEDPTPFDPYLPVPEDKPEIPHFGEGGGCGFCGKDHGDEHDGEHIDIPDETYELPISLKEIKAKPEEGRGNESWLASITEAAGKQAANALEQPQ